MYRFRSDLQEKKLPLVDVPLTTTMMCLNESALDPWSVIREPFLKRMESLRLNRYFTGITAELHSRLATYAGVPEDCLLWGNGADQMLHTVFTAVREDAGTFAVSLGPSYFDYRTYATAVGMSVRFITLDPATWDFDLAEYLACLDDPQCRLAILCHPNNPTGHLLDEQKICAILEHTGKPVLIDETYFEYSGRTFRDELARYPHLIIVRSFSKAFSAAGLRFGYLLSSPENVHELKKVMCFFNTSLMVQTFALTILEHESVFAAHTAAVIALRGELLSRMREIPGVTVHPSHTNFLAFTMGETTPELYRRMIQRGIALRDIGAHPVLRHYLRVTVSSPEDNRLFLSELTAFQDRGDSR